MSVFTPDEAKMLEKRVRDEGEPVVAFIGGAPFVVQPGELAEEIAFRATEFAKSLPQRVETRMPAPRPPWWCVYDQLERHPTRYNPGDIAVPGEE